MADYADVPVTTDAWTALASASEDVTLQVLGGPVYITDHSAPGAATGGLYVNPMQAVRVASGKTVQYRLASGVGATIVRSTLG